MADLARVRVTWSGAAVVGDSVSTFYTTGTGPGLNTSLRAFFDSIKARLPVLITLNFPSGGEIINSIDGKPIGSWTNTAPAAVSGTDNGNLVQGAGMRIVWNTAAYRNGRRVRGSTFLAPAGVGSFDTNGLPSTGTVGVVDAALAAFVAGWGTNPLVVYTRPNPAGAGNGGYATVTSANLPRKASSLRSRRT